MKTIDIVYSASLKQVQGVNYVNSSFIQGQKYFEQNGLKLGKIVTPYENYECEGHDKLDIIGQGQETTKYVREKKFRRVLKVIFSSKFLLGALVKYYFNVYRPSKTAAERYLALRKESDYILFQGVFEAYYYFKLDGDRAGNVKTVWMNHGDGIAFSMMAPVFPALFRYRWVRSWLFYKKYRYAVERLDKVIFLSQKATDACQDIDEEKKTYIYNGEEDISEVKLKHTQDIVEIACVGSVNYRKGQDKLIQALGLLENGILQKIHVNIIGGGPQLQELKEYAKTIGIEKTITFWGVRNDVSEVLKEMDVFCLPSANEGMPMVIIEALRQGLYILGTDTGGIKEMIRPEFGKIITRNPKDIAETIQDIIVNNRVTDEARKASRRFYEANFTLKKNIDTFSEMFKSL